MRTAAQCVGRVLRGKTDWGLMVFADKVSEMDDGYARVTNAAAAFCKSGQAGKTATMDQSIYYRDSVEFVDRHGGSIIEAFYANDLAKSPRK